MHFTVAIAKCFSCTLDYTRLYSIDMYQSDNVNDMGHKLTEKLSKHESPKLIKT